MKRVERQLRAAGVDMKHVTIVDTTEVEVAVFKDGAVDYDATRKLVAKIRHVLHWGGYQCAHGGWVLQKGYEDKGDWNNRASAWHY